MTALHNDKISKTSRSNFLRNEQGSIAIVFALVVAPMVMALGIAVDYGRAHSAKATLQAAADAAAIAGASHDVKAGRGNRARKRIALNVLQANATNLAGVNGLQKTVSIGESSINVIASIGVKTTFASIITPEIGVSVQSSAAFGLSAPLCLLALNGSANETFRAWGTADLIAPDCAVQSHSVSSSGMATGGSATATAAQFCSAGGHSGTAFSPEVQDKCTPAADPYVGKYTAAALEAAGVYVYGACNQQSTVRVKSATTFDAGGPTNVYVFCGGINLQAGATAEFKPGVYVINNAFSIGSGATVNAPEGVTFFLRERGQGTKDGYLTVQGGANLNLVAPRSGPLAGMAIVNPYVSSYTGGTTPALTHTVIGGGRINIVGTIYTPQAKVRVTGNGTINDTSTYFSIVADFVELEGNGQLYINAGADVTVSGLPTMTTTGQGGTPVKLIN